MMQSNQKPMRVIDIQRAESQLGRIRTGYSDARGQPQRSAKIILTSNDKRTLDRAAALYGGEVQKWEGRGGEAFRLFTERAEIPILIGSRMASQAYEKWGEGGPGVGFVCLRRCDGANIFGGLRAGGCCQCEEDPKERAKLAKVKGQDQCVLVTRLEVRLPELPGLGVWRLDTHGFFAATELPTTTDPLNQLAKMGIYVKARLGIEVRRSGAKKFPVPVVRMDQTFEEVLSLAQSTDRPPMMIVGSDGVQALNGGSQPALLGRQDIPPVDQRVRDDE